MGNTFDQTVEQIARESIQLPRPAMPLAVGTYVTPILLSGPVVAGKVQVPVITNLQSVQSNPTSFESSTDAVDGVQADLEHLSAQFGFSNPQQAQGLELRHLLASHLTEIEKTIQARLNSLITESNFSAAVVTATSSAYALANCETLLAAVPARTILALTPDYFVRTKSTWMPAGQESVLKELSNVTAIGENVTGFSARPEAIAAIYGFPTSGPGDQIKTSTFTLPIGLPVQFSRWWSRGGRSWRGSLDICLAVAVGQSSAMRLIRSAAPE